MSNIVFERFLKEKRNVNLNVPTKSLVEIHENAPEEPIMASHDSPIVSADKLRERLMEKINPKPKIIMETQENTNPRIELIHFTNIDEFVSWYEKSKDKFPEKQQKPLDSLVEARNMTVGGCNCNRQHRKNMAEDYFRNFWVRNEKTDILPTLSNILNAKKIIFGDFLSYPP
jgi:hypothetical protein